GYGAKRGSGTARLRDRHNGPVRAVPELHEGPHGAVLCPRVASGPAAGRGNTGHAIELGLFAGRRPGGPAGPVPGLGQGLVVLVLAIEVGADGGTGVRRGAGEAVQVAALGLVGGRHDGPPGAVPRLDERSGMEAAEAELASSDTGGGRDAG